ncbi:MAG: hypothetical protein QHH28_04720, partial [Ignavibacteria bacterium]|nr:hypothetical protein [Ignavibacteria bacterium]
RNKFGMTAKVFQQNTICRCIHSGLFDNRYTTRFHTSIDTGLHMTYQIFYPSKSVFIRFPFLFS